MRTHDCALRVGTKTWVHHWAIFGLFELYTSSFLSNAECTLPPTTSVHYDFGVLTGSADARGVTTDVLERLREGATQRHLADHEVAVVDHRAIDFRAMPVHHRAVRPPVAHLFACLDSGIGGAERWLC